MKDCKGMNEQIGKAVETMAQIIEDITVVLKEAQEEKDKNKITVGDVVQNDNRMRFVVTQCGDGPDAVCEGITKYGGIVVEFAHNLKKTGEHIHLIDDVLALLKEDDE